MLKWLLSWFRRSPKQETPKAAPLVEVKPRLLIDPTYFGESAIKTRSEWRDEAFGKPVAPPKPQPRWSKDEGLVVKELKVLGVTLERDGEGYRLSNGNTVPTLERLFHALRRLKKGH